jgi:hypothetical protein
MEEGKIIQRISFLYSEQTAKNFFDKSHISNAICRTTTKKQYTEISEKKTLYRSTKMEFKKFHFEFLFK